MKIAIVVPSIRPESLAQFKAAWRELFIKHAVDLFVVQDGNHPGIFWSAFSCLAKTEFSCGRQSCSSICEEYEKFLYNINDGVRNIGFLAARKFIPDLEIIITLDDDVLPDGNDPIQEHIDALQMRVPISWFCTAFSGSTGASPVSDCAPQSALRYMRGFPYTVREEADVWVSHGVWTGVHDYDGPSQLVNGNPPATFYKGPIPKGCLTPICGMNLAFRVEALPYLYFAPMGRKLGVQRFADIWMGIQLKRELDKLGKAIVSGYATVRHLRASNVFANLEQEARGLRMNEDGWKSETFNPYHPESEDYAETYRGALLEWQKACAQISPALAHQPDIKVTATTTAKAA